MMNAKIAARAALVLLAAGVAIEPGQAATTWGVIAGYSEYAASANGVYTGFIPLVTQSDGMTSNRGLLLQQADFSASSSVAARGIITYGLSGKPASPQAADASSGVQATMGGLRAKVGADNTVSDYLGIAQFAQGAAGAGASWHDVVTFHTSNPLGSDYTVSVTLDDALSTSLAPSQITNGANYYVTGTESGASAEMIFNLDDARGSTVANLVINDGLVENLLHADPVTGLPGLTQSPPPSRTLTATFHIFDGTVLSFDQRLDVHAHVYQGNGTAGANAEDTAFLDLSTTDAAAWYVADSGTVYATAGDPFAVGVSPVPEPGEWALLMGGFGLIGAARQRAKRARAGRQG